MTSPVPEREGEGENGRGHGLSESERGNCIRWIGCRADVGEEGIDGKKGNSRERENEGASLLIG